MFNASTRSTKSSGFALAAAAATLFLSAPMAQAETAGSTATGHCMGANACKGQGACKSAANACKGQNGCKGQGFTESSEKECVAAKGRFEKLPAKS